MLQPYIYEILVRGILRMLFKKSAEMILTDKNLFGDIINTNPAGKVFPDIFLCKFSNKAITMMFNICV
jgi:hypothetical protein